MVRQDSRKIRQGMRHRHQLGEISYLSNCLTNFNQTSCITVYRHFRSPFENGPTSHIIQHQTPPESYTLQYVNEAPINI